MRWIPTELVVVWDKLGGRQSLPGAAARTRCEASSRVRGNLGIHLVGLGHLVKAGPKARRT
jgi:hypothetical protein